MSKDSTKYLPYHQPYRYHLNQRYQDFFYRIKTILLGIIYKQNLPHVTKFKLNLPHVTKFKQNLPHVTKFKQNLPHVTKFKTDMKINHILGKIKIIIYQCFLIFEDLLNLITFEILTVFMRMAYLCFKSTWNFHQIHSCFSIYSPYQEKIVNPYINVFFLNYNNYATKSSVVVIEKIL